VSGKCSFAPGPTATERQPNGRIRTASPALVRNLGLDLEAAENQPFLDLVAAEDRSAVADALAATSGDAVTCTLEARLVRPGGQLVWHRLTVVGLVQDPVVAGLVVTAQDVATLAEARHHLHYLATHDGLTGIANRVGLVQYLAELRSAQQPSTAVFIDLDGFKQVNDRFGHRNGDIVLAELARRLREAAPSGGFTARLGGDEFVVVVPRRVSSAEATLVVDGVVAAVAQPVALHGGISVTVNATCGVAVGEACTEPVELLAAADAAMYAEKRGISPHERPS
jgi:diguanylate cyclase (GGDEF)-like protein/PAS domain S-box-containing protein